MCVSLQPTAASSSVMIMVAETPPSGCETSKAELSQLSTPSTTYSTTIDLPLFSSRVESSPTPPEASSPLATSQLLVDRVMEPAFPAPTAPVRDIESSRSSVECILFGAVFFLTLMSASVLDSANGVGLKVPSRNLP